MSVPSGGRPASIDFHLDLTCPYAYQTSLWIREVRERTGLAVNWRFFSLEEINRAEGKKHPWEREWSYGWSLMRIGALLRRQGMDLLARMGLDPGLVAAAIADPTTGDEVLAEHRRVTGAGGFGVPTLFFPDGQCLFGPVLINPPAGEAAERLWDAVVAWTAFPHLYEIQRPKGKADTEQITTVFRPYLQARDWVSVNRGTVVDVAAPATAAAEGSLP